MLNILLSQVYRGGAQIKIKRKLPFYCRLTSQFDQVLKIKRNHYEKSIRNDSLTAYLEYAVRVWCIVGIKIKMIRYKSELFLSDYLN